MPEHFSQAAYSSESTKRIDNLLQTSSPSRYPQAVVFVSSEIGSQQDRITLGHQYLFAAIPVSSLYLQHGPQVLLDEILLDILLGLGFDVFVAEVERRQEVYSLLAPQLAISAKFAKVTLSAFDALFFRISRLRAELSLTFYSQIAKDSLIHNEEQLEISKNEYSRYAFAPFLSDLFRKEVSASLGSLLQDKVSSFKQRRVRSKEQAGRFSAPALLILPPSWDDGVVDSLGRQVADSYGFAGQPAYTEGQLSRLCQRGMFSGASELGFLSLQSIGPKGGRDVLPGFWTLRARVLHATQVPVQAVEGEVRAFRLEIALKLSEVGAGGEMPLRSCLCKAQSLVEDKLLDGAMVSALQTLGKKVLHSALAGPPALKNPEEKTEVQCLCS